ncbi:lipoprotein aminopeptidase LpqL [Mycobacterium cookii]|uniref:Lipoprotein aminopeptidase LpqL n=2 Tax=Mycobacterium cookii TaxID=1775 RepID=A0A7I7L1W7_9MYCO|nr:lipoprotein aminopeptidase LpqL [Mycobacterium cookii]
MVIAVTLMLFTGGCASPNNANSMKPVSAPDFAASLRGRVTTDAMMAHLTKLSDIAKANNNTRAVGTPGYDASVDYVAGKLRDKGFDVQTPQFEARVFHADPGSVTIADKKFEARALEFSLATPPVGVTGPLVAVPVDASPGCNVADYDNLPVNGAVVLVDRGTCPFSQKEKAAVQRGAVAMVVADNTIEEKMGGTLGESTDVKVPVVSVTKSDGALLRTMTGPATVQLSAETKTISARNVIAQTKTGSTSDVVMAGAHLDSVPEGPGINDNGSGVAAVLETALQLGNSPGIHNAVRVGFWGAEELGLIGSRKYVESLDLNALKDIALYLNFDMLASPNPGYFTYDGDQSLPLDQRGNPVVPEGSAGIERSLAAYLNSAGKTPQDTSFDGRSDYDGFTVAGIPAGGLFSGAEVKETQEEAKLWGGAADQPFDPNYHKDTDTLDHIDKTALGINGGGVAYSIGLYAQDLTGRNGVPVREDRTRHTVSK